MSIVYISLGSNMGNGEKNIAKALKCIENLPSTTVLEVSSLYLTEPISKISQPHFLNCCAKLYSTLSPHDLLRGVLKIELELGRVRKEIDGPRTIDIDLLLYDDLKLDTVDLILPHPRMLERDFVLVPLSEICDKFRYITNFKSSKIEKLEKKC